MSEWLELEQTITLIRAEENAESARSAIYAILFVSQRIFNCSRQKVPYLTFCDKEYRILTDMIFVKKFTQPQFWQREFYAKKA